ncbi:hypothetical protein ABPG75_007836 [Micractinium tetrahymenae]
MLDLTSGQPLPARDMLWHANALRTLLEDRSRAAVCLQTAAGAPQPYVLREEQGKAAFLHIRNSALGTLLGVQLADAEGWQYIYPEVDAEGGWGLRPDSVLRLAELAPGASIITVLAVRSLEFVGAGGRTEHLELDVPAAVQRLLAAQQERVRRIMNGERGVRTHVELLDPVTLQELPPLTMFVHGTTLFALRREEDNMALCLQGPEGTAVFKVHEKQRRVYLQVAKGTLGTMLGTALPASPATYAVDVGADSEGTWHLYTPPRQRKERRALLAPLRVLPVKKLQYTREGELHETTPDIAAAASRMRL